MGRGLYNQSEGNEQRSQSESLAEQLLDNELIEGEHVKLLSQFFKERRWESLARYCEKLLKDGHAQTRIDSMLTRAGVRKRL